MHQAVLDYVGSQFHSWKADQPEQKFRILEFGSLDINGSVRSVLQHMSLEYVGVDVQSGPGVDVTGNAATFDSPARFDVIVCAEVFEHTPAWREIIVNSHRLLRDGGIFIATMAGEGRAPHSAIDENPIRDWEYYDNVGEWELSRAMRIFSRFSVSRLGTDIRAVGVR